MTSVHNYIQAYFIQNYIIVSFVTDIYVRSLYLCKDKLYYNNTKVVAVKGKINILKYWGNFL